MNLKILKIDILIVLLPFVSAIIVNDPAHVELAVSEKTPVCIICTKRTQWDDSNLPPILAYCTCAILSPKMVITAKACFIQFNWYVYIIEDTNGTIFDEIKHLEESRLYKIAHVYDSDRITVAYTEKVIEHENYSKMSYNVKKSQPVDQCYLVSYVTPSNKPIMSTNELEILKSIWKVGSTLIKVPVEISGYEDSPCHWKHSFDQPPLKTGIEPGSLLCITPKSVLFDTCAPDLGAPIFCDDILVGILSTMINRPPDGIQNSRSKIPLHVPNSCYTPLNNSSSIEENYSYLAENLKYYDVHTFIEGIIARRQVLDNMEAATDGEDSLYMLD
ncbi:uncharacterized protein LOC123297807 [Chrysoperla carnea]|uniref:uncharacterized protein LOC123297807 n=1 Tax=Chrysoperla carnea TaxID=189513 RepID=UPI001D0972CC|nr:uncharacterized protein LOC123297807 [Chrysoperla carnea]